jgi:DNA replication protein DnaC
MHGGDAVTTSTEAMSVLFKKLRLPSFLASYQDLAAKARAEGWDFEPYLKYLAETEIADRERRRVERNLRQSHLPSDKTLATLEMAKLPRKVTSQLPRLCDGDFVRKAENVLVFGLPGRGKTHVCAAIGHELIQAGYQVLFQPVFRIVQQLLLAKRDFELERMLKRLDHFDVVVLDDIGYVQQDREEMEVLFTFLAERYERRSVMITSNLVFSEWDKIFKDPMTTAAAIDRVVHHSTILELSGDSYRAQAARSRMAKRKPRKATSK